MNDMSPEPKHARRWTFGQRVLAGVLILLGAGLTVIAFIVIWGTVTKVVRPYMKHQSWTVVTAGEIAFLFMYGLGILLAWRKAPAGLARGLIMTGLIAGSVVLNIYAARGVLPDLVAHLLIVGSFFGVLIAGKGAITALRGGKVRADRISAGEWLAHPLRSLALSRWMQTWGEPSRKAALSRYLVLLYVIALIQADPRVGRRPLRWRKHLPVTLRFELSTGQLPAEITAGEGDWQAAAQEHVRVQLSLLDNRVPAASGARAEPASETTSGSASGPAAETESGPASERTSQPGPAVRPRLTAKRSRSMSAAALEPWVSDLLDEDPTVSLNQVIAELHVGRQKASEALRLARKNRMSSAVGAR